MAFSIGTSVSVGLAIARGRPPSRRSGRSPTRRVPSLPPALKTSLRPLPRSISPLVPQHVPRSVSTAGAAKAVDAVSTVVPSLVLSPQHGYVALVLVAAVLVHNFYMSFAVGAARRKFGVQYPAMYAEGDNPDANLFNCTQRGHQNSLESLPSFLALLLVAGIKFPVTAAIAGAVYTLGKIVYFNGYASGNPNKRLQGAFSYFGLFTLIGCVIRLGISLIMG